MNRLGKHSRDRFRAKNRGLFMLLLTMQSVPIRTFLRNFPLQKCHDAAKSEMIRSFVDISLAASAQQVA
jgi:hypothetical protein